MRSSTLPLPELFLIAATRVMLGAGVGLLLAKRLTDRERETAGVILTAIGVLSTIPLAMNVLGKSEAGSRKDGNAGLDA